MEEFDNNLIEKRKEKIINFVKKPQVWVIGILVIALILGVYIRSLPMQDHGGTPGLWDFTTNDWTLGPDLDPWLFTRVAGEIIDQGKIPQIDTMRNVPLGFDNSKETVLLPYMIAWTYKVVNLFGDYSIEFAAVIFPVIMFFLTIISFFLFVREIFIKEDKESKIKANVISLISTFFMVVIPVFLSRTVAGIPEKESAAFFFLFLALFFFLKSWKQEKIKKSIIWGILAGIATAGMALVSGLYILIFAPISISCFLAFILNKFEKNQIATYTSWWISTGILFSTLPGKVGLLELMTSLTLAPAFFLLILLGVHSLFWRTQLSKTEKIRKIRLPKTIISIIVTLVVLILIILILKPSLISDKMSALNKLLFKPTTGRWNTTVAENSQPHFVEWVGSFGPYLKNIPVFFWLFFIGSIVLFKKMLKEIRKFDSWILTILYVFFLCGMVFSRYSDSSIFTGESFISKVFYITSVFLLGGGIIYYYNKYYKEGERSFERIDYALMMLLSFFIVTLFSARGAVRLVMVLGSIAPIFVGYLNVELFVYFLKNKNENKKIYVGICLAVLILLSLFCFVNFYKQIKVQSYNFIPSYYNQQWQKAMDWIRQNTPEDSVFSHWWDYGYWVQSIGKRATVLDGGNAIKFWNYWMGRLVLTGNNQKDALDFLYSHNTNYLLIDSSDIGKYGAFSIIGSDENYDRLSWIGTFLLDEKQIQETKNETIYVYPGGVGLDEDLIIIESGKEIFLPQQKAVVIAIVIPMTNDEAPTMKQPSAIIYYNGIQYKVDLRYVYVEKRLIDFKEGINSTAYIFPYIASNSGRIHSNPIGAIMYLSPRLMRGMLSQKYILNDPFNNFPNFELVHSEENLVIESLNSQGMNLPEFIYYQGIQGPIKIWEIEYTGEEIVQEKYLDRDSSKYLSWEL